MANTTGSKLPKKPVKHRKCPRCKSAVKITQEVQYCTNRECSWSS